MDITESLRRAAKTAPNPLALNEAVDLIDALRAEVVAWQKRWDSTVHFPPLQSSNEQLATEGPK